MIEIWSEGFMIQGGGSPAQLLHTSQLDDFDKVIEEYNNSIPEGQLRIEKVIRSRFNKEEDYINRKYNYTYWGCAIYDNEQQARKSFG